MLRIPTSLINPLVLAESEQAAPMNPNYHPDNFLAPDLECTNCDRLVPKLYTEFRMCAKCATLAPGA